MKSLSILGTLLLCAAVHFSANAGELDDVNGVGNGEQVRVENAATKLKFTSRRPHLNAAVKNRTYEADDAWQGATDIQENASNASKRLNRQFRSRRPYIDYQFD
jgi:hypothetical protein